VVFSEILLHIKLTELVK